MRRIREKLHNRSGASVLFAILVFMLCILAGTAALTAAAANAGRYSHLEEEQQTYLTLGSAIRLLKDEISGREFSTEVEVTRTEVEGEEPETICTNVPKADNTLFGRFCQYFESGYVKSVKGAGVVTSPPTSFTISGIGGMDPVTVKEISVDPSSYNITMTIELDTYTVQMVFPATTKDEYLSGTTTSVTDPTTEVTTTTTTWTRRGSIIWDTENVVIYPKNVVITGMGAAE